MNKGREMFNVTYKEEEIPTEISPDTSSSRSDKGKRKDRRICYSPDGMKDKNDSSPEPQNDHEDEVLIVQCKEEEIPTEISSGLAVSWDDKAESYECFPFAGAGTGFRPVNLPNLSAPEAFPPNFSSSEEEFLAAGPPADPRSMDRTSSISKYNRIDTNRMTNTGQDLGLNFTNAVPFYTPRPAQSATACSPNQPGISYICSDCGKEFKQHRLLLRHKKIHTGEKPFTCLDCGSAFRLSSELLTHRRKHTGERPYACPDCDKCFKHNRNLKTHRLSHIGEKPFSCAECHKSFRARSVLVRHRLIHTGEKPYSCSFCDRRFIQKSNLLRHLVVHTRGKTLN